MSRSPIFCAFCMRPFSTRSSVTSAAAQHTGLPPKVEPCAPLSHFMMLSRAMIAPSGMPLASPFAVSRMSGSTPSHSHANILPVRPIPHWISSNTSRMPWRSHRSRSAFR